MKITGRLFLLLLIPASMLSFACGQGPEPATPIPAQESITNAADELVSAEQSVIQCEGPADELALLSNVCGLGSQYVGGVALRDVEWGNRILVGDFYFYVMGSPDDLASLSYAAGVETFTGRESVVEGRVNTTFATPNACSTTFEGSAEFLWRNTTIRMHLSGFVPC